jgi:hypothetical protein
MTSTSTIGTANPPALARTVRDVIAHQPELVNEVWCRKIFRHILLALERSHTLHLPHAPVSPDTVGFDAAGDAILVPSAHAGDEPGEAQDIHALCELVHHAITGEPQPVTPLRGRAPGYSESLVGAVDKCLFGDPAERPQTIGELRNLLGIVALGPAVPSGAPMLMPDMPVRPAQGGARWPGNWRGWLLIGLAAVVLLAAAAAFVTLLHGADAGDNVVLTLPEAVPAAKSLDPNEKLVRPPTQAPLPALPAATPPAAHGAPATPAPAPVASRDAGAAPVHGVPAAPAAPAAAPQPATAAPARPAPQAGTVAQRREQADRDTTYKLMIKPWGTVYVDGDERGVSPPLKKLTLPAGRHTLRVVNPNYRDRVIRIEAGKRAAGRIDIDFSAPSR